MAGGEEGTEGPWDSSGSTGPVWRFRGEHRELGVEFAASRRLRRRTACRTACTTSGSISGACRGLTLVETAVEAACSGGGDSGIYSTSPVHTHETRIDIRDFPGWGEARVLLTAWSDQRQQPSTARQINIILSASTCSHRNLLLQQTCGPWAPKFLQFIKPVRAAIFICHYSPQPAVTACSLQAATGSGNCFRNGGLSGGAAGAASHGQCEGHERERAEMARRDAFLRPVQCRRGGETQRGCASAGTEVGSHCCAGLLESSQCGEPAESLEAASKGGQSPVGRPSPGVGGRRLQAQAAGKPTE